MRPFQLSPLLKPKPWGGRRLEALGKTLPDGPIGESWEVADLPEAIATSGRSVVLDGPHRRATLRDVIDADRTALLGSAPPWRDGNFPLLIKFLDAAEHLSVQVHPDEQYVSRHPGTHTKSESWYVIAAEPNSVIYAGLHAGVTETELRKAAGSADVVPLLRSIPAVVGELHDIPAGTIHALGAGVMVAEIQTPSDTTFRLYDWTDEFDRDPRQLHVAEAIAAADLQSRPATVSIHSTSPRRLVATPYYAIDELRSRDATIEPGRIAITIVVAGRVWIDGDSHDVGTTLIVPASAGPVPVDATDGTVLIVGLDPAASPISEYP